MPYDSPRRDRSRAATAHAHAALFVDYENLSRVLAGRLPNREHPHGYVAELLDALRRRLREEYRTPVVLANAYADFTALQGDVGALQRALLEADVTPRPTSSAFGAEAVALTLALEAAEAAARPDLQRIVVVAGDRAYLPLVQHLKRLGRQALVVTIESPVRTDTLPHLEANLFLDTHALFGEASRKALFGGRGRSRPAAPDAPARTHEAITDASSLQTLEVIEEHFGQYDEVYLTPLLRKLSESFEEDDPSYDPKAVVADLERAGAVWLEKRRGFPYDYTVLLVDDDHPDVQRVQDAYDAREPFEDGEDDRDLSYEDEDDWAEPAR